QFIERGNRNCGTGYLIAAPNNIAELFLAGWFIEETKFFRPNLIENDATGGRLNYCGVGISKGSLLPAIRALKQNPVMRFDRAFDHREFDFGGVRKQR